MDGDCDGGVKKNWGFLLILLALLLFAFFQGCSLNYDTFKVPSDIVEMSEDDFWKFIQEGVVPVAVMEEKGQAH
jgi:hypothetical protein